MPQFNLDAEAKFYRKHGRLQSRSEKIKSKILQDPSDNARVLDRFQVCYVNIQHHRFSYDLSFFLLLEIVGGEF